MVRTEGAGGGVGAATAGAGAATGGAGAGSGTGTGMGAGTGSGAGGSGAGSTGTGSAGAGTTTGATTWGSGAEEPSPRELPAAEAEPSWSAFPTSPKTTTSTVWAGSPGAVALESPSKAISEAVRTTARMEPAIPPALSLFPALKRWAAWLAAVTSAARPPCSYSTGSPPSN